VLNVEGKTSERRRHRRKGGEEKCIEERASNNVKKITKQQHTKKIDETNLEHRDTEKTGYK
jgi:hypothetical protein